MGKLDSLRNALFGMVFDPIQESGFKPVFRVVSQESYADTKLGIKLLIDTLPADLRAKLSYKDVRDDYSDISTGASGAVKLASEELYAKAHQVVKQTVGSIKDTVVQSMTGTPASPEDRPLEGCMIDFSLHNQPFPFGHVIFQNPTRSNPRGDQLFGTDLLKVGFPIWIYAGYMDQFGNIVSHPFDPRPQYHIPLVFAGFIGAISQEITEGAGDRMQLQLVGYMWYLENFTLETTDILQVEMGTKLEVAIGRLFFEFYRSGGSKIPKIVKKALRLTRSKLGAGEIEVEAPLSTFQAADTATIGRTPYLSDTTHTFKPAVRYIYGASKSTTPVRSNSDNEEGVPAVILGVRGQNFGTIMQSIEVYYDVDIEWDVHGYLTVHGKEDPYTRMLEKKGKRGTIKKTGEKGDYGGHDIRVHDAIIGGNVRNLEMSVAAEGVASGLRLTVHSPSTSHPAETYIFDQTDIEEILRDWEKEGTTEEALTDKFDPIFGTVGQKVSPKKSDMYQLFGDRTFALDVIHYSTKAPTLGKDYIVLAERVELLDDEGKVIETEPADVTFLRDKIQVPWPKRALQALFRRLKYWGMRGSAMMIGNSHIREGDLLRITDVRPKGSVLNVDLNAYRNTTRSIAEKVGEILDEEGPRRTYRRERLGIEAFDNIYFIWKIRHYVGPPGYWTKVYFVKQRDAQMRVSPLLRKLRGRKGAPGDDEEE